MADKKYRYQGPLNSITLPPVKEGDKPRDITLHNARDYDLPDKHPQVAALVANGFLVELPADIAEPEKVKPAPAKGKETSDAR